ncbi:MAG TPA: CoA transferase [Burkholderiaceae bacterium]|nr:CoA transferase [Burkholderiaceae bacterium]
MSTGKKLPLAGLRVIELGQLIAGPFCGRMLGDFGADVIKVEPPGTGDPLRHWRVLRNDTSLWWHVQSRNKRSVAIDLRHPEGQELVRQLASEADVLIENFRPGTMEQWGLDYASLSARNPGLIMLRISGYGQTGPYRDRPGFGVIGEAMGGLRHLTGQPGEIPVRVGVSLGDSLSALHGTIGVLMALYHRKVHGGPGQEIDVALYESVFNMMESLLPEYAASGVVRGPAGSALPGIAPSNAYRCSDGIVLIAGNGDTIFRRLMQCIGREDLAAQSDLQGNPGRVQRVAEIDAAIEQWTRPRSVAQVLEAMDAAKVPAGRIYTVADIASDPQYLARDMIVDSTAYDGESVTMPGFVPKLAATPGALRERAPRLGEHTDTVLADAGLDTERIAALRARRVIE